MSKIIFNDHQRRQIEENPNVASVSDRSIQYTADFKLKAVQENLAGKGPVQIFQEAGFDLEMIGIKKLKVHWGVGRLPIKHKVNKDF